MHIFIDRVALVKQENNRFGRIYLSVCVFVCAVVVELFDQSEKVVCMCNQRNYVDNFADAVDQLLIDIQNRVGLYRKRHRGTSSPLRIQK